MMDSVRTVVNVKVEDEVSGSTGNDESIKYPEFRKESDSHDSIAIPATGLVLSFVFPLIGWACFLACLGSPPESRKWLWAKRCNAVASTLVVLYVFLLSCVLGQ
eukprot:Selendium_serpulae@DN2889_c0_g1_i1.p1